MLVDRFEVAVLVESEGPIRVHRVCAATANWRSRSRGCSLLDVFGRAEFRNRVESRLFLGRFVAARATATMVAAAGFCRREKEKEPLTIIGSRSDEMRK